MKAILKFDYIKVEYRLAQASSVWGILMFCNSKPEQASALGYDRVLLLLAANSSSVIGND